MRAKSLTAIMTVIFVAFLHLSCSNPASALMSTLGGNANLSGITSLLNGAGGLGKILGGTKNPFTLLAPTNDALSALGGDAVQNLLKPENMSKLTDLLKKHVLPGKYDANQIKAGGLKDAAGNALNLGGANITQSLPTTGGLVQVIDKVLQ